jgi:hypothetical protein
MKQGGKYTRSPVTLFRGAAIAVLARSRAVTKVLIICILKRGMRSWKDLVKTVSEKEKESDGGSDNEGDPYYIVFPVLEHCPEHKG